jgi:hypothetical protein
VPFALLQRGVLVDHGLPGAGVVAALIREGGRRGLQRGGDDLDRGGVRRCGVHAGEEPLHEQVLPVEEDLALVVEVAEEGALGQADGLRDLRGGRLLEPAGGEQFERGLLQPCRRPRLPTRHAVQCRDGSD